MAEKRKKNKKQSDEPETPTKEEYAIASYLRFNVPTREGKLRGLPVTCFFASKAVEALLDSKWATKKGKTEAIFTTRQSCVDYCHSLLLKGLFHRALRTEKRKDKDKKSKKALAIEEKGEKIKKSKKKEEKDEKEEKPAEEDKEKESEKKVTEKKDEEKKKKKKMKLEMHDEQHFRDGDEMVYVWIYDPTPLKNKIIGLLLVLGAIGVCLFPLWPPEVRQGVYYLSLVAAGFVGFILVLCVLRVIVFCIVWALTMGKHHLWLLPNLTEDVGFFDSFKPLYKHEFHGETDKGKDKKDEQTTDNDAGGGDINTAESKKEADDRQNEGESEQKGENNDTKVDDSEIDKDDGPSEEKNGTDNTDQSDSNGYEVVSHEDLRKDSK